MNSVSGATLLLILKKVDVSVSGSSSPSTPDRAIVDSDGDLLLDSDGNQLVDSDA